MSALTDDEWRAFQAIPDQGYSHRGWVDARIAERLAARDAAAAERAWDEGSRAEMDASRWNKPRNPYRAARIARGEGR